MGSEWFKVREVGDATWAIDDQGSDLIYLVAGQERCLLIDTGWGVGDLPALVASLSSLPLTVVNTHGHPDHISGNMIMKQATGASILIHENHSGRANPDQKLSDGDVIKIGNYKLVVLHTPGHTKSGISILGDGVVFTGDTLFAGSVGRTDFPGGSFEELINSIKTKLVPLPDHFKVYPGHESFSTIGNEKKYNPYLQR